MAQGQLDIGIVLNGFGFANEAFGVIQSRLEGLRESIRTISSQKMDFGSDDMQRASRSSQELAIAQSRLRDGMQDLVITAGTMLSNAMLNMARSNREAGMSFEQMSVALNRFRNEGQTTQEVMQGIINLSKLPMVDLQGALRSTIALRSTRMEAEDTAETITQFSTALASVGASSDELQGVTRALTQIMAKGKVYAEEIHQIAERLPQTRAVMQDAFGTANTEELAKEGIGAYEFIREVTAGLKEINVGTEDLADTTANAITNLNNQLFLLKANMAGNMEIFKGFNKLLTDTLEVVNNNFKGALGLLGTLISVGGGILKVSVVIGGTTTALGLLIKSWSEYSEVIKNSGKAQGLLSTGMLGLRSFSAKLATSFAGLARTLGVTSLALTGWIALAIGVITALTVIFLKWRKSADKVTQAYENLNKVKEESIIMDQQMIKSQAIIDRLTAEQEKVKQLSEEYKDAEGRKKDYFDAQTEDSDKQSRSLIEVFSENLNRIQTNSKISPASLKPIRDLIDQAKQESGEQRTITMTQAQENLKKVMQAHYKAEIDTLKSQQEVAEEQVKERRKSKGFLGFGNKIPFDVSVRGIAGDRGRTQIFKEMVEILRDSAKQGDVRFGSTASEVGEIGDIAMQDTEIVAQNIDGVIAMQDALKDAYKKLREGGSKDVDTSEIDDANVYFRERIMNEKVMSALTSDAVNLNKVTEEYKGAIEELERKNESWGTNAEENNKFLVRTISSQKNLVETRLSAITDGLNLDQIKELAKEHNVSYRNQDQFQELLKGNEVLRKAYQKQQETIKLNNDKERANLELRLRNLQSLEEMADDNLREGILMLSGGDKEGFAHTISLLKNELQGKKEFQNPEFKRLLEDIQAEYLRQYGEQFEVTLGGLDMYNISRIGLTGQGDSFKQVDEDFKKRISKMIPQEQKRVTAMRQFVADRLRTGADTTATQFSELIKTVQTMLATQKGGSEYFKAIQDLLDADRDKRTARGVEETKTTQMKNLDEREAIDKRIKELVSGDYKELISALIDRETEGIRLQQKVDSLRPLSGLDNSEELKRAENRLKLWKARGDITSISVSLARANLEMVKDLWEIEKTSTMAEQNRLDLAYDNTKNDEEKTLLQNKAKLEIDLNEQRLKINESIAKRANIQKAYNEAIKSGRKLSNDEILAFYDQLKHEDDKINLLALIWNKIKKRGEKQSEIDQNNVSLAGDRIEQEKNDLKLQKKIHHWREQIGKLGRDTIDYEISQLQIDREISKARSEVEAVSELDGPNWQHKKNRLQAEVDRLIQEKDLKEKAEEIRKTLRDIDLATSKRESGQSVFQAVAIGAVSGRVGEGSARQEIEQMAKIAEIRSQITTAEEQLKVAETTTDRLNLEQKIGDLKRQVGRDEILTAGQIVDIRRIGNKLNESRNKGDKDAEKLHRERLMNYVDEVGTIRLIDILTGDYLQKNRELAELIKEQTRGYKTQALHFKNAIDDARMYFESQMPDSGMASLLQGTDFTNAFKKSLIEDLGDVAKDPAVQLGMLNIFEAYAQGNQKVEELKNELIQIEASGKNNSTKIWQETNDKLREATAEMMQIERDANREMIKLYNEKHKMDEQRLNQTLGHMEKMTNLMSRMRKAEFDLFNPMATDQAKERFTLMEDYTQMMNKAEINLAKLGNIDIKDRKLGTEGWNDYSKALEVALETLVDYTEWQVKSANYNKEGRNIWKEMIEKEMKYHQARENIENKHVSNLLKIQSNYTQEYANLGEEQGQTAEQIAKRRNEIQSKQALEEIKAMRESDKERIQAMNEYRQETAEFRRRNRGVDPINIRGKDPLARLAEENPQFAKVMDDLLKGEYEDEIIGLTTERDKRKQSKFGKFKNFLSYGFGAGEKVFDKEDTSLFKMGTTGGFRQILSEMKGVTKDLASGKSIGEALTLYAERVEGNDKATASEWAKENLAKFKEMWEKSKPVEDRMEEHLKSIKDSAITLVSIEGMKAGRNPFGAVRKSYDHDAFKKHNIRSGLDIQWGLRDFVTPMEKLRNQTMVQSHISPDNYDILSQNQIPNRVELANTWRNYKSDDNWENATFEILLDGEEVTSVVRRKMNHDTDTGKATDSVGGIGLTPTESWIRESQAKERQRARMDEQNRNHASRANRSRGWNETPMAYQKRIAEQQGN